MQAQAESMAFSFNLRSATANNRVGLTLKPTYMYLVFLVPLLVRVNV